MQELTTKLTTSQLTDDGEVLFEMPVKRSADVGSDHHLVVAQLKLTLAATKKRKNLRRRYDVGKIGGQKKGIALSYWNLA